MKIESLIDSKTNKIHIHITELTKGDFMYGERWRNFEGRERVKRDENGKVIKIVNSKGNRHFAIRVPQDLFMSDPLFEELVRRNMFIAELKPNPDFEQYEPCYALEFRIGFKHDPENKWKDPEITGYNGEKVTEYDERNLVDLDHLTILGGEIMAHTYESTYGSDPKCSLYIEQLAVQTNPPLKRESLREKYRAMLQHDESDEEPIPFN